MKKYFWKKIAKSTARIAAVLAIILGISALCYWGCLPLYLTSGIRKKIQSKALLATGK